MGSLTEVQAHNTMLLEHLVRTVAKEPGEGQAHNTMLLEHLVRTVAKEPGEGQELHKLLATLVAALQELPAKVEAAVTRGVQAG